ncbi:MAG TPA: A24 family peptidase [Solirubrobacterales bacterium]|nr:A24 family peptidase [Solirubrobacterales bacterium]
MSIERIDVPAAALAVSLIAVLAVVTATDLQRRVIPNRVLVAGALVCAAIVAATDAASLPERVLAASGAGGFLLLGAVWDRRGMGMGDVKLAAVMGLYLGAAVAVALLVGLVAGGAVGAVMIARHGVAARTQPLPFGPFLALGGIVALAVGDTLIDWYLDGLLR